MGELELGGSMGSMGESDGMGLTQFAPAKVNLFLHVTGRRDNGYHSLESLCAFADVGDMVTIEPSDGDAFSIKGVFGASLLAEEGAGSRNLVIKARDLYRRLTGIQTPLAMTLEKALPIAAGIGGGSADAAATLIALNKVFKNALPFHELLAASFDLGADVPMCVSGGCQWVSGVGDVLVPCPFFPSLFMVMVNPLKPLSTPAVFQAWRASCAPFSLAKGFTQAIPSLKDQDAWIDFLGQQHNDLSPIAEALCPEVGIILHALGQSVGCKIARLSGSGATCFGLYTCKESAAFAAKNMAVQFPSFWVKRCAVGMC